MILSSLGLTFAVFSGIIIVFFFRNYEFNESNLLKRRFRLLIVLQMILRCFQVFLYYQNFKNSVYVKHILVHIIGIMSFIDYYVYWPFSNNFISIFYLSYLVSFQNLMIFTSIWIFSDSLNENNIFNLFLFFNTVMIGVAISFRTYLYRSIMTF
jgi:hypothetical protein